MRAGYCCRQALAVTAVGLFALVLSGCGGGGKNSPGDYPGLGVDAIPSSNANLLSSLVLSAGTLAPPFGAETTSYSAEVAYPESSVTVTPTAEDGKATITVNGVSVPSGTASQAILLTVGSNDIEVVVTAEDRTTTRTYTVSVECGKGWVLIESGTFMMGSPELESYRSGGEEQHPVKLTNRFVMSVTEVTQAEFEERMGYNPSCFQADKTSRSNDSWNCDPEAEYEDCPTCPVENVTWHEAAAYCNALSTATALQPCYTCTGTPPEVTCTLRYETPYVCPGYRLPTEAEWEYAARAGDQRATYAGELTDYDCDDTTLTSIAWFCGNSDNTTHAVGTKVSNDLGLYDMLGNVWEWGHDWYDDYETDPSPIEDPMGPPVAPEAYRVIRGGSWESNARNARAAYRNYYLPAGRDFNVGLRPVRSLH